MRATKGYVAGVGTTGALVGAIGCAFAVMSAVVAVHGWPLTLSKPDVGTVEGPAPAEAVDFSRPVDVFGRRADAPAVNHAHAGRRPASHGADRVTAAGPFASAFGRHGGAVPPVGGSGRAPVAPQPGASAASPVPSAGSGAVPQQPSAGGPTAGGSGGPSAPSAPPPAGSGSGPTTLSGAVTQVTSGTGTAVTQTGQQLSGVVQGTTGQLGGAVSQVSPALGQAVTQTGQAVGGIVGGATSTGGQVVSGAGATIGGVLGRLGGRSTSR
jgi:hypothetical protein